MGTSKRRQFTMPDEELYVFEILKSAIGASFTSFDDNSEPAMVDGLFVLPCGTKGAVEVTRCGAAPAFALAQKIVELNSLKIDSPWSWLITVGNSSPRALTKFAEVLPIIDQFCRATEVTDPVCQVEWINDLLDQLGITGMRSVRNSPSPGSIAFITADGGFCGPIEGMTDWLEEIFRTPLIQQKVSKLRRTERDEQHLALCVHQSCSMPFHLRDHLMVGDDVPSRSPFVAANITGVWLLSQWKAPILWWSSKSGWQRFHL